MRRSGRTYKGATAVAGAVAICMLGASCSGSSGESPGSGHGDTLRIALGDEPRSLNPILDDYKPSLQISEEIVQPLIATNDDFKLTKSGLVTDWKRISQTSWAITLRKGIKFTNGEPWNAKAAKFSIQTTGNGPSNKAIFDVISNMSVLGNNRLKIQTDTPNNALPAILSWAFAYPPKLYKKEGGKTFGRSPVGTGPYEFKAWSPGQSIELTANQHYWGNDPSLSSLKFTWTADDNSRLSQVQSGQADIMYNLSPAQIPTVKKSGSLSVKSRPTVREMFLVFNRKNTPFSDRRARLAAAYAINRKKLTKELFKGLAEPSPTITLTSETAPDAAKKVGTYPYRPEKARKLVESLGHKPEITLTHTVGRYVRDDDVAQALEGMLRKVGFGVKDGAMETGSFAEAATAGNVRNVFMIGFGSLFPNDDVFAGYYLEEKAPYPQCRSRVYDALAQKALASPQPKASQIYLKMGRKLLHDDVCAVGLYRQPQVLAVSNRVKGLRITLNELMDLSHVKVTG